ncbi:MAG: methionine--tRNA ligase [Planctomycetota bacterium]|nr:MAG: methionine--tRNA ligase [Planctomycetota bacterium]
MTKRKFLITSALPYSNGRLHVGHVAGAYLPADIFVRYLKARGDDVAYICGSDDFGAAIEFKSWFEKRKPEEIVAEFNPMQLVDFNRMNIEFEIYGGTSLSPRHPEFAQHFFTRANEEGLLEKIESEQWYDPEAEKFLPDRYVQGKCYYPDCESENAFGDQCEGCGRQIEPLKLLEPKSKFSGATPEVRKTTHWYFNLPEFEAKLRSWIDTHPEWRSTTRSRALKFLNEGLRARPITRDLKWGIPVPLDDPDAENKVLYVWFDAPIGYVSFTADWCEETTGDWKDYEKWWKNPECKIIHFIGEDNAVFHTIIWPGMLMAEGSFQLPHNVVVSAFLNMAAEKMSKSRGTAIWLAETLDIFEPDALRYYLTAIAPEPSRTGFYWDDLIARTNGELVATLGNFLNRWQSFVHKRFDARVPPAGNRTELDREQLAALPALRDEVSEKLESYQFKAALETLMKGAQDANKYFDTRQPWVTGKDNLEDCGTAINVCIQTARSLTVLMAPFLPNAAESMRKVLNLDSLDWQTAGEEIPEGAPIAKGKPPFRKLDTEKTFEAVREKFPPE